MISIENLHKSFYGLFSPVLNGIDLHLEKGEFCVIIGSNGCGKSTLLKVISGDYTPSSGTINVQGKVAQVVQDVNLGTVSQMTLLENIALNDIKKPTMGFFKRYKKKAIEKIQTLEVGLERYIDSPLKSLSGGQKQMVATLMAVTSGCDILLLDEHTSALDPKTQAMLMKYTAEKIVKLSLTALMVTHKMADAIQYGDRLIMLHRGKKVLDVKGAEKRALTVSDLLNLFHTYQNQNLGGRYGT